MKRKRIRIFRQEKAFMDVNFRIGIDLQHPVTHHFDFVLPHSFSRRYDLTVQICQTYLVIIDEVKGADPAAHKGFAYVTADTSDTKDRHPFLGEPRHAFLSQKQLCS